MLKITRLSHTYPGAPSPVLREVSLTLEPGRFLALMGPSGCGKSTLLHLCGAMRRPGSGSIELDGVDLATAPEATLVRIRRDQLGFVFQSFNLLPTLTALENAALPLRLAGETAGVAEPAAAAWLDRVGLGQRARHYPAQLSGGERQRVAIARAFLRAPRLILADEPTGSLDSENGAAVAQLLREMNAEHGAAILMATHDPAVAAAAQDIVRMKDGLLE